MNSKFSILHLLISNLLYLTSILYLQLHPQSKCPQNRKLSDTMFTSTAPLTACSFSGLISQGGEKLNTWCTKRRWSRDLEVRWYINSNHSGRYHFRSQVHSRALEKNKFLRKRCNYVMMASIVRTRTGVIAGCWQIVGFLTQWRMVGLVGGNKSLKGDQKILSY